MKKYCIRAAIVTQAACEKKKFSYSYRAPFDDIYGAKSKFILWIEREATNFIFCGVYSGDEDDLSSSKGHRNTQSNLRERLTNISDEKKVKKQWIRQRQQQQ